MAQLTVPSQPKVNTQRYADLLGVDYQSDPTEISRRRSPKMVNMMSDQGGIPVKRFGYRKLGARYEGIAHIGGDTYACKVIDSKLHLVKLTAAADGSLTEGEAIKLSGDTAYGDIKHVFGFKESVYVLCQYRWIEYNTETGNTVSVAINSNVEQSYLPADKLIPTVATMYKPKGDEMVTLPAGTSINGATQGVNILTPWRRVEYCVTVDTAAETKFVIPGQAKMYTSFKVETLDPKTFDWREVGGYSVSGRTTIKTLELDGTVVGDLDVIDAYIVFSASPYQKVTDSGIDYLRFKDTGYTSTDVPAGVPNVRITFAPVNMEEDKRYTYTEDRTDYTIGGNPTTITLVKDPWSYISMAVADEGTTYDLTFNAGEAESYVCGGTTATYDGNKSISFTTNENWLLPADDLYPGDDLYPNGLSVISVRYNAKSDEQPVTYKGFFRDDRTALYNSDAVITYESRLFGASGARTYYSIAETPFMVQDNCYFDVDNKVRLYAKSSGSLAVIADDVGGNCIYLAKGAYDGDLAMTVYSITASNASVGAITSKVSGTFNDEPMFLAHTGIYGITTNYYSEKFSIPRSGKINKALVKEANLANAVGFVHGGYFYVAVNGHMYILDSRHRDTSKNGDSSYECYYFEGMPLIRKMFAIESRMYFADDDYLYTWNDALDGRSQYIDNAEWDADLEQWMGKPVCAMWCSAADDDGAPQYYKVLQKKGTMVTIAPPMQTSCQITLVKNGVDAVYAGRFDGSKFALSDGVLDAVAKKKVKKYKRLQFVIENNEAEPFGVISVVKSFILSNYAKR